MNIKIPRKHIETQIHDNNKNYLDTIYCGDLRLTTRKVDGMGGNPSKIRILKSDWVGRL